jgi:hypothetical protein
MWKYVMSRMMLFDEGLRDRRQVSPSLDRSGGSARGTFQMTNVRKQHRHEERERGENKVKRMQFDVDEIFVEVIEDVMKRGSIGTYKDFYAYATTLFVWAIEEAEAGRVIGTVNEGQLQQFQMPPLLAAKARAMRANRHVAA